MNRPRWRLRPLLAAGIVGLLLPILILAERAAEFSVRRVAGAADAADALGDLRATFLVLGIISVIAAIALAAWIGGHIVRQLRRLRTGTAARARGVRALIPRSDVAEVDATAGAIDLLATELERRCDDLSVERDELALLLNSVSEGILQVASDGRIVHANPAARVLLGIRPGTGGQPVSALVRNADLREVIESAAAGEHVGAREVRLDERRLLVAARPLHDARTDVTTDSGAVVAFTDLTEIRRLEGVRRDFVANVSHELKTPLTSIRGYVETLLTDELPPDMQRQFLEVIRSNAARLHGIVDDLLDLSRLESGGWRPQLQRLYAMEVVEDVWNTLRDVAGRKHIEFEPEGENLPVIADPAGLRQILSNLLDNAVRYTPEGGRVTVRVSRVFGEETGSPETALPHDPDAEARPRNCWVIFEIRDTGVGIPRDALSRIFERFYRVDPARSRAEGGTGLGLSIVRHLVDAMGGDVTAQSELGKGALLRFRLPAA